MGVTVGVGVAEGKGVEDGATVTTGEGVCVKVGSGVKVGVGVLIGSGVSTGVGRLIGNDVAVAVGVKVGVTVSTGVTGASAEILTSSGVAISVESELGLNAHPATSTPTVKENNVAQLSTALIKPDTRCPFNYHLNEIYDSSIISILGVSVQFHKVVSSPFVPP